MFVETKRKSSTVPLENFSSEPIRKSAATQRTPAAYHSSGSSITVSNFFHVFLRCGNAAWKATPENATRPSPSTAQKQDRNGQSENAKESAAHIYSRIA